jgi:hypothetical protein
VLHLLVLSTCARNGLGRAWELTIEARKKKAESTVTQQKWKKEDVGSQGDMSLATRVVNIKMHIAEYDVFFRVIQYGALNTHILLCIFLELAKDQGY